MDNPFSDFNSFLLRGAEDRSKIVAMSRRTTAKVRTASASHFSDQGFVRVKTVLALLLLGVAGLVIYRIAPPYFANAQLSDKIRTEARFAEANDRTPYQVRGNLLRAALELEIPLQSDNIRIEMNPSDTLITADYTVTVDLYYTKVDWDFHIDSRR